MAHRIEVQTDVDAECEHCGQDLLCPECDPKLMREYVDAPPDTIHWSEWMRDQLRAAYEKAVSEGRWQDGDALTAIIEWSRER